jgi:hypothetical protein
MQTPSQISHAQLDHVTGGGTPPAPTPTGINPGNCGLGGVLHSLDHSVNALNSNNNNNGGMSTTDMMMFGMAMSMNRQPNVVVNNYGGGGGWGWHRHCW